MFGKRHKDNGEKVFRYSIRKYHFGAASVAIAALIFFANGVAQAETLPVRPETANVQSSPGGERSDSGGRAVSEIQPAEQPKVLTQPVNKDALRIAIGNLSDVVRRVESSKLVALESQLTQVVEESKRLLEDGGATEQAVATEVETINSLIREVEKLLPKSEPTVDEPADKKDKEASIEHPKDEKKVVSDQEKSKKDLSIVDKAKLNEDKAAVNQGSEDRLTSNPNKVAKKELPTYSNENNGATNLSNELYFIYGELKKANTDTSKIQEVKDAYDRIHNAVPLANNGVVNQAIFDAALVDLKKARDLIEGVLSENEANGGEVTGPVNPAESATPSENNVTIQPRTTTRGWSGFRNVPAGAARTRAPRAAGQDRDASNDFENSRQFYFEDGKYGAGSGYDKYSYIFYSKRELAAIDNNNGAVSEAPTYIYADVNRINNGFAWNIYVNRGNHGNLAGSRVWFTVPKNQVIVQDSVNIGRGKDPDNGTSKGFGNNVAEALRNEFTGFSSVSEGTPKQSNIQKTNKELVERYPVGNLGELSRYTGGYAGQNYYVRNLESSKDIQRSNAKFNKINDSLSTMYSFTLPDTADAYRISFITRGDNIPEQLVYAVGMRGTAQSKGKRVGYLVNQFYARTNEDLDEAESNKFKILGNTYFKIKQNTINAELNGAEGASRTRNGITYIARQGDYTATQPKMDGVLTYDNANDITGYDSIDISSYGDYYETNGITKKK